MAWRGTPKISIASQYKKTGIEPVGEQKKNTRPPNRVRANRVRSDYKRSGYATRFFVRQLLGMANYFQSAHLVSALVAYAWAPGMVATTL